MFSSLLALEGSWRADLCSEKWLLGPARSIDYWLLHLISGAWEVACVCETYLAVFGVAGVWHTSDSFWGGGAQVLCSCIVYTKYIYWPLIWLCTRSIHSVDWSEESCCGGDIKLNSWGPFRRPSRSTCSSVVEKRHEEMKRVTASLVQRQPAAGSVIVRTAVG
jgi:hypothetical protein